MGGILIGHTSDGGNGDASVEPTPILGVFCCGLQDVAAEADATASRDGEEDKLDCSE